MAHFPFLLFVVGISGFQQYGKICTKCTLSDEYLMVQMCMCQSN